MELMLGKQEARLHAMSLPFLAALALTAVRPSLSGFMAAAILEELLFREVLLRRWLLTGRWARPGLAVLLSAGLFAVLHAPNIPQILGALGFGLWAGVAVWRTDSVLLPALLHLGINAAAAAGLPVVPLYIDPGTGSMLFAVLIGVLGVLRFVLKGALVKLRFWLSGGRRVDAMSDAIPLAIFSDDKRYWPVFEPVIRELNNRSFDVTYMTASGDDPALKAVYPHLHAEFIGEGNRTFARLNFVKATLLLSTTPGVEVYQWKRSKEVGYYIHMLHAPSEFTTYKMFGIDHYDAMLLSGQYQIDDCRALERLRGLPEKECVLVGIPYLDEMARRLKDSPPVKAHPRTVLVAPSWGSSSILNRFGRKLIDALLETGYSIIVRPHPQSFTSEREMIEGLMAAYPTLEWNRDTDNFEVLRRSDILISDFSGIIFDFALVFDRPVICAYTEFDKGPYDAWWLDTPIWTSTAVPRIGPILSEESLPRLKAMIYTALEDAAFARSRHEVRDETWACRGEGAVRAADYIEQKYRELTGGGAANEG